IDCIGKIFYKTFSNRIRYWLKGCMAILKLDKHDEDKEIEFELDYLTSLTTKQRFELMLRKTEEMLRLLKKDKPRKTTEVIKRKPD
ncbi:MAG: hypothetical protein ABIL62_15785, partial [Planctomycetota bacterium]